jgi:CrcB protein
MTWSSVLLVGFGSALGTLGRYSLSQWIGKLNHSEFPWGTWLVNIFGTFLLGVLFSIFAQKKPESVWWLFFGTGFCGAFTTFSTFSVETIRLFQSRLILGVIYLGSSISLGLFAAWVTQLWL